MHAHDWMQLSSIVEFKKQSRERLIQLFLYNVSLKISISGHYTIIEANQLHYQYGSIRSLMQLTKHLSYKNISLYKQDCFDQMGDTMWRLIPVGFNSSVMQS